MKKIFLNFFLLVFTIPGSAQLDQTVDQPEKNFEAFWQLFNNNYATFPEKNINWDSIGMVYRPTVNAATTNEDLFHTFCEMIKPLGDAHVNLIVKKANTTFSAEKQSRLAKELKPFKGKIRKGFDEMVKNTLHENGFNNIKTLGKDYKGVIPLFWYGDNGKVGYLRVGRCFSSMIIQNGIGLNNKLNKIFKYFAKMEAIVIDIRMNPGGTDGFSKKVVNRLTDKKLVGYYKQTRKDQQFGALDTHYIKPKGKHKFLKPVFLLTNEQSVSAADVMALMMAELPNVTIIGENSNGSYSDLYSKKLPNKWKVTLSNQRYLSTAKINYEGIGTPVDLEIKNTLENYNNKNDLILKKALELIGRNP